MATNVTSLTPSSRSGSRLLVLLAGALTAVLLVAIAALAAETRVVVEEGGDEVDRDTLIAEVQRLESQGLQLSVSVLADEPSGGAGAEADRIVDANGGAVLVITPTEVHGASDEPAHDTSGAVDQALDVLVDDDDIVATTAAFGAHLLAVEAAPADDRVLVEDGGDPVDRGALIEEVQRLESEGLQLSVSVLAGEPSGGAEAEADRIVDARGGAALVITPTEVGGVSAAPEHDAQGAVDRALDTLMDTDDIVATTAAFGAHLLDADAGAATPGVMDDDEATGLGGFAATLVLFLVVGLILLFAVFRFIGRLFGGGRRHGPHGQAGGRFGGALGGAAVGYGLGRMQGNRNQNVYDQRGGTAAGASRGGASGGGPSRGSASRSSGSRSRSGSARSRSSSARSRSSGSRGGRSRGSGRRR